MPAIPATLAPGALDDCTGTHTITQADLDAGSFNDTASATSTEAQRSRCDTITGLADDRTLALTRPTI